jgi:very-short-patch-repair endonuclease
VWAEFKRSHISAERQEFVRIKRRDYALDFAVYCHKGKIDVETDGDVWHSNAERAADDNRRDNDLRTTGWSVLRFNTLQVSEQLSKYCMPTIIENINRFGGLNGSRMIPRRVVVDHEAGIQLSIFDIE